MAPDPGAVGRLSKPSGYLVGRDEEQGQLIGLVERSPMAGQTLVVLGEAGIGKSALVAELAERARSVGLRVLTATGRQSETNLAFSGLHELLRPILDGAANLPERQRIALGGALGTAPEAVGTDRLLIGIATLTLLSEVSERSPVLAIVEDAHWLDGSSLGILEFVGHRLAGEQIVLVITSRENELPRDFDRSFPEVRLRPLTLTEAKRLLDMVDDPPRGRARAQILAQSAGNPLALIELAKVIAADRDAGRRWIASPVPLTERLSREITGRLAALPDRTRAALLHVAVADGADPLRPAAAGVDGVDVDVLAPAERAGLVKLDQDGLHFSHPIVRSAIYHSAPFALRAAAHRRVADGLADQPDRRAWHLAAAVVGPDEEVAALLEATATQAHQREGAAAAALAMERAAELSPSTENRARRFVAAASMAVPTGQFDWVRDLATRGHALTADPELRVAARRNIGGGLVSTNQQAAAISVLLDVVGEASSRGLIRWAWDALGNAATAANYLGTPAGYQSVRDALELLDRQDPGPLDADQLAEIQDLRLWIQASSDRFASRDKVLPLLQRRVLLRMEVAGAAFSLDESQLAAALYRDAVERLRAPEVRGTNAGALMALGFSLYDIGHWDEALVAASEADEAAAAYKLGVLAGFANWTPAMIHARRGDVDTARHHVDRALSGIDTEQNRTVVTAIRHALGVAAIAEGFYLRAFTQLCQLFTVDGTPTHVHRSYLGVADLAEAAVRAERPSEGRELLRRVHANFQGTPSPRLKKLFGLARATLAEPGQAEADFNQALSDSVASQWPFERAQAQLAYGQWLRRRRRINEAKPVLLEARDRFQELRAAPYTQRAQTELRACGVTIDAVPDAVAELTPQQLEIVRLASAGLTNREIGDKLFLSPRTVGSHLHRCYPKLGVTSRHQLRDVIGRANAADDTQIS